MQLRNSQGCLQSVGNRVDSAREVSWDPTQLTLTKPATHHRISGACDYVCILENKVWAGPHFSDTCRPFCNMRAMAILGALWLVATAQLSSSLAVCVCLSLWCLFLRSSPLFHTHNVIFTNHTCIDSLQNKFKTLRSGNQGP